MSFKQLAAYPVALTLLTLAVLACGPADESVRRGSGRSGRGPTPLPARGVPFPCDSLVPGCVGAGSWFVRKLAGAGPVPLG